jgi:hypothetical protein
MSMTEPEPINDELLRMTGDPKVAEGLKEGLRRLRDSAGGSVFAEMAKDLLEGRTSLRQVGSSSSYGQQLSEAFSKFQQWQSELSAEEREALERKAGEQLSES